jgi:Zn-dependent protease
MMRGAFKLGTLAGIDIRVDYTWFFAFVLIAWSLAQGYFPTVNAGFGAGTYWVLGLVSALLLFGSVLVHELGHSLVAGARGIRVDSITLFIFGGVSNITKEASTARDEFLIAVVGPVTSLVLAGVFWALSQAFAIDTAVAAVPAISRSPIFCSACSTLCRGSRSTAAGYFARSCGGRPATCRVLPGLPPMSGRVWPS